MQTSQMPIPAVQDLVLLGGGHAHVQVLKRFAMRPAPGVRITVVSRELESPYSGMLPGCVAGVYPMEELFIRLRPLCRFANARLIHEEAVGLDLENKLVCLAGRPDIRFDVLSINSGAVPVPPHPEAVTVKPIGQFLPKWRRIVEEIQPHATLAIVGGGAGGLELAFACRAALSDRNVSVKLVGPSLLPGHNGAAQLLSERLLEARGIEWIRGRAQRETPEGILLETGEVAVADEVLWVTDVRAPTWLAQAGLSTDQSGFINVSATLQSTSHADVFGAGDVAHLEGQARPKSGVYAVRAGPILAHNLRRRLAGQSLKPYKAQLNHLALIGTGDGRALATRGAWARHGRGWWRLKDGIDKRFMKKFNDLPALSDAQPDIPQHLKRHLPEDLMRCGGCGAKVAADPLRRVLARLPSQRHSQVVLGIGDDAAQITNSGDSTLVTVDGFRSMVDDPYLFGRIAAHHSLNDIYAMAAKPETVLAFTTVPLMAETMMEEELFQLLSGVVAVLQAHDVALVGGHSAEGAELSIGLTVTGSMTAAAEVLRKSGAQIGDHLIVTKPIGTGVLLAAAMRAEGTATALREVMDGMDTSNAQAVQIFIEAAANALTDITGFGLVGHLSEMLRASQCGVELDLSQVATYSGAVEAMDHTESSLQKANELALNDYEIVGIELHDNRLRLLADPQTSGGLLASVPANEVDEVLAQLRSVGYLAHDIGIVQQQDTWRIRASCA